MNPEKLKLMQEVVELEGIQKKFDEHTMFIFSKICKVDADEVQDFIHCFTWEALKDRLFSIWDKCMSENDLMYYVQHLKDEKSRNIKIRIDGIFEDGFSLGNELASNLIAKLTAEEQRMYKTVGA